MDIVGLYEQLVIFLMRLSFQALKFLAQGLLFGGVSIGHATPPLLRWIKKRSIQLMKLGYWVLSTQLIPGVFFATFLSIKLIVTVVKSIAGLFGGRAEMAETVAQSVAVETKIAPRVEVATVIPAQPVNAYTLTHAQIQPVQTPAAQATFVQPALSVTRQEPAGKSAVETLQAAFLGGTSLAATLARFTAEFLHYSGKLLGLTGSKTLDATEMVGQNILVGLEGFRTQLLQPGLAAAGHGGSSILTYAVSAIGLLLGMAAMGLVKTAQLIILSILWLVPKLFSLVGLLGSVLVKLTVTVGLFLANLAGFTGWMSIALAKLTLKLLATIGTGTVKTGISATQAVLFVIGLLGKLVIQLAKASSFASQKVVKTSVKHSHKLAVNKGLPFMAKVQSASIVLLSTAVWAIAAGSLKVFQAVASLLMQSQTLAKRLERIKLPKFNISVQMPKFEFAASLKKVQAAQIFEKKQAKKVEQTEVYELVEPVKTAPVTHVPYDSRKFVWLSRVALSGIVVSLLSLSIFMFPDLFFRLIPYQSEPVVSAVDQSKLGEPQVDLTKYAVVKLPPKDESLPKGQWLRIPKIGVETQIQEHPTANYEDALRNGVWRVPEFGDPTTSVNYPMIVVAHRFGYLSWSNEFRKKNSFYQLDKLQPGDTFEVIWDQRKFTYEIYAGEEGKDVTDYSADVVLYTCKYLNAQIRILRYAKRVEI